MCEGLEPEAMWACLDCYSILLQVTARGGAEGLLGRRAWLAVKKPKKCGRVGNLTAIVFDCPMFGGHFSCASPSICTILITSLIDIFAVLILFSYPFAVSSEFFLSQPVIFVFCASKPPLQPPTVGAEERGEEVSELAVCFGKLCRLESFSGRTKLGSTTPKP